MILFQVTYHGCYRDQFSIAFDAYLDILRRIQEKMNIALGRDTKDWRLRNACPPCNYKVS